MVGLTAEQIHDSRLGNGGRSHNGCPAPLRPQSERACVEESATVTIADKDGAAGFDDGAITQVVAEVALSIFTNYFNQVAGTDIDFPKVPALNGELATAN